MPKVSEAHKAAVRERLVRAGLECVQEKGYDRTTTRDILQRSGLSAGAFYHYFRSKEELIAATGDYLAEVEFGAASSRVGEADSAATTIAMLAAGLFRLASLDSLLPSARVQAAHVPAIREGLARYDAQVVGAAGAIARQARSDGDLRDEIDPEALTELALIVYEGIQSKAQSDTFVTSPQRVAKTFMRLLALGAAAKGSPYRDTLLKVLGDDG
jgi:AcrR family transcriptional regulator